MAPIVPPKQNNVFFGVPHILRRCDNVTSYTLGVLQRSVAKYITAVPAQANFSLRFLVLLVETLKKCTVWLLFENIVL